MKNKEGNFIELFKNFLDWTKYKLFLHVNPKKDIYFYEGQIWWAALGRNVGFEMDGKNEKFHRPVLILKKYNKEMCFVLPLTTKTKNPSVWYQISISGSKKIRSVNISQGRTISIKRLLHKDSVLETEEFFKIKDIFKKQFK